MSSAYKMKLLKYKHCVGWIKPCVVAIINLIITNNEN